MFDAQSLTKETPTLLFEVQWRPRMESAIPKWETSAHLLRSNICRKKNLRPSTCYEFRYLTMEYNTSVKGRVAREAREAREARRCTALPPSLRATLKRALTFASLLVSIALVLFFANRRVRACSLNGDWSAFSDTAFAVTHAVPATGTHAQRASGGAAASNPPTFSPGAAAAAADTAFAAAHDRGGGSSGLATPLSARRAANAAGSAAADSSGASGLPRQAQRERPRSANYATSSSRNGPGDGSGGGHDRSSSNGSNSSVASKESVGSGGAAHRGGERPRSASAARRQETSREEMLKQHAEAIRCVTRAGG